jgi:hypothetical protein
VTSAMSLAVNLEPIWSTCNKKNQFKLFNTGMCLVHVQHTSNIFTQQRTYNCNNSASITCSATS